MKSLLCIVYPKISFPPAVSLQSFIIVYSCPISVIYLHVLYTLCTSHMPLATRQYTNSGVTSWWIFKEVFQPSLLFGSLLWCRVTGSYSSLHIQRQEQLSRAALCSLSAQRAFSSQSLTGCSLRSADSSANPAGETSRPRSPTGTAPGSCRCTAKPCTNSIQSAAPAYQGSDTTHT